MRVSREKIEHKIEHKILTGMIVSDRFLREVESILNPRLLEIPFATIVCDWCLKYLKQYEKAPGRHVQDLFNSYSRTSNDEEMTDAIGDFLQGLSDQWDAGGDLNVDYLLDEAEKYLKARSLQALSEDIQAHLTNGDSLAAEGELASYKRVARPVSGGVNPFSNADAVFDAFEHTTESLFSLPGALGCLVNDQLVREGFIGILGTEKVGKTWWLMEFAFAALMARRNVAFFGAGDMSMRQMIRRFHIRLAGKSDLQKYCGDVKVPVLDCAKNQHGGCPFSSKKPYKDGVVPELGEGQHVQDIVHTVPEDYRACCNCSCKNARFEGRLWYETVHIDKPLTWREGLRLGKQFMFRLKGRDFKVSAHPTKTLSVKGIRDELNAWEHFDNFVPDVILVDYADILASEENSKQKDFRHQTNETWAALRALSQEKRALVITPTQADAAAYEQRSLKLSNFSEDKRKYAHVTGFLSLNQMPDEKRDGLMRIGWLLLREGDFDPTLHVKVLQCLQIGRPLLDSFF